MRVKGLSDNFFVDMLYVAGLRFNKPVEVMEGPKLLTDRAIGKGWLAFSMSGLGLRRVAEIHTPITLILLFQV